MTNETNITGIILAGGKSSRMRSDKGFVLYEDKPFMQHIIDAMKPLVSNIIIVSNDKKYDVFGLNRINDVIHDAGPLAGVYSGLKHSKTELNLVLSCDVPLINTETLQKLIHEVDAESDIIQIKSKNKTMPLIAMYKKGCENKFLALLNQGERRLQYAVNQCRVKTVVLDFENESFTANINTPEQLKDITA